MYVLFVSTFVTLYISWFWSYVMCMCIACPLHVMTFCVQGVLLCIHIYMYVLFFCLCMFVCVHVPLHVCIMYVSYIYLFFQYICIIVEYICPSVWGMYMFLCRHGRQVTHGQRSHREYHPPRLVTSVYVCMYVCTCKYVVHTGVATDSQRIRQSDIIYIWYVHTYRAGVNLDGHAPDMMCTSRM